MTVRPRHAPWLVCAGLVAAVMIAFYPALRCGFIPIDDPAYVTANPDVRAGLAPAAVAHACSSMLEHLYHPLSILSFMLDKQVFGLNPGWLHAENVLFHAVSAVVLFLFLRSLTGSGARSAVVAGVFALHPLRVESVVWIAERKDVLAMLFGLLAMWGWLLHIRSKRRWILAPTLACFVLSLLAKPMLVALPAILLLLDVWPLRRWVTRRDAWPLAAEKWPIWLVSALFFAINVATIATGHVGPWYRRLEPLDWRVANAAVSYCRYLWKLVDVASLIAFYPLTRWSAPQVAAAALCLTALSAIAFLTRRKMPWLLVGWTWFVITLLPVCGINILGMYAMADRYSYFPTIGLLIAGVWSIPMRWFASPAARRAGAVAVAAGLLLLAATTWRQSSSYRDGVTLAERSLALGGADNLLAQQLLAMGLSDQGRIGEADGHFRQVEALAPDWPEAYLSHAAALEKVGQLDPAIAVDRIGVSRCDPFAALDESLAFLELKKLDAAAAIAHFEQALTLNPTDAPCHNGLGQALAMTGHPDEARGEFIKAIALDPTYAAAVYNLGYLAEQQGDLAEAELCYRHALAIQPDYAAPRDRLGKLATP